LTLWQLPKYLFLNILTIIQERMSVLAQPQTSEALQIIREAMPESVELIDFILVKDFNGDGADEIMIGYTSARINALSGLTVLYAQRENNIFTCRTIYPEHDEDHGALCHGAFAEDTNGDGKPELIMAVGGETGSIIKPFIYHFEDGQPVLYWQPEEYFIHEMLDVIDINNDGIYEIIATGSIRIECDDVWASKPSCREYRLYQWNGTTYKQHPYHPDAESSRFNTKINFIIDLWREDYESAYNAVQMPTFLGLDGLTDCSLNAFISFVNQKIRPSLMRNISINGLRPEHNCCFVGDEDIIYIGTTLEKGEVKITHVFITKL
jgi:hypothetical protein